MNRQANNGRLILITGPMFSGKTEELIRRLLLAKGQGNDISCYKPALDTRYDVNAVVSHNKLSMSAIPIHTAEILLDSNTKIIGLDEAQFMDKEIVRVVSELLNQNKELIISGLERDYLDRPFGLMPELISMASTVIRLRSICSQCGKPADHTYRKVKNDSTILLGETDSYEARCKSCYKA